MDRFRFAEVIEKRALDRLRPDVCHFGGLAEMKAIATLAETRFLPVAPQNPMGPVGNAMTLQLAAILPKMALLETMMIDVPWRGEVVRDEADIENGAMRTPDAPGLGVTFDAEGGARHPSVFRPPGHFRERAPWPDGSALWFSVV